MISVLILFTAQMCLFYTLKNVLAQLMLIKNNGESVTAWKLLIKLWNKHCKSGLDPGQEEETGSSLIWFLMFWVSYSPERVESSPQWFVHKVWSVMWLFLDQQPKNKSVKWLCDTQQVIYRLLLHWLSSVSPLNEQPGVQQSPCCSGGKTNSLSGIGVCWFICLPSRLSVCVQGIDSTYSHTSTGVSGKSGLL